MKKLAQKRSSDSHEEASPEEIKRTHSHEEASPEEIKRREVSWTLMKKLAQKRSRREVSWTLMKKLAQKKSRGGR